MLKFLPRKRIANLPTPLHAAERLSRVLNGPRILFKRDDLTGPALGGQKARMLEYVFGEAMAKGCDVVVSIGSWSGTLSPHIAAAANALNIEHITICLQRPRDNLTGTGLLHNLMDPEVIQTPWTYPETLDRVEAKQNQIVASLKQTGRRPYVIGLFSKPLGMAGFFYTVPEIMAQLEALGETASHLYVAHATGVTHGGLLLGSRYYQAPFNVVGTLTLPGISTESSVLKTTACANAASDLLGAGISIKDGVIILSGRQPLEPGIIPGVAEAIRLVAKTEGILLDPHYTGRAMATLIDHVRRGKLTRADTVIFYHSGGAAMLFSYTQQLQNTPRTDISALYRE